MYLLTFPALQRYTVYWKSKSIIAQDENKSIFKFTTHQQESYKINPFCIHFFWIGFCNKYEWKEWIKEKLFIYITFSSNFYTIHIYQLIVYFRTWWFDSCNISSSKKVGSKIFKKDHFKLFFINLKDSHLTCLYTKICIGYTFSESLEKLVILFSDIRQCCRPAQKVYLSQK